MREKNKVREIAALGLLAALALTLSFLEGLLPPVAGLPPGIKLGLSNIVVMYAMMRLGSRKALLLGVLKGGFSLLLWGVTGGLLSLAGGLCSVAAMLALRSLFAEASIPAISVTGAVFHNLGQLLMAWALLHTGFVIWYYALVLLASGICMGLVTSVLLRTVLPHLDRLQNFVLLQEEEEDK